MGSVIFSFDFELGWGAVENSQWRILESAGVYQTLQSILRHLVSEMDVLEIPATWAIVGAMVSSPDQDDFSYLPDTAKRNIEIFLKEAKPTTKDGRDLLETVLTARVPHEIASHSFSHTRFDFYGYDVAAQTEDLKKSMSVLEKLSGQLPKSFVFPQNIATNFEVIETSGFRIARTNPGRKPVLQRRFFQKLFDNVLHVPPAVTEAKVSSSLISHSSSLFFNWGGYVPPIHRYVTLMQSIRAIHRTAKGLGDTHFWLHPFNMAITPNLENDLIALLCRVAKLRDKGKLKVRCMCCL